MASAVGPAEERSEPEHAQTTDTAAVAHELDEAGHSVFGIARDEPIVTTTSLRAIVNSRNHARRYV